MKYQKLLLNRIAEKLAKGETIGYVLSEVLNISLDAAYRRYRCETYFSIGELAKISQHFNISMDELLNPSSDYVRFQYSPLSTFEASMENYFTKLHEHVDALWKQPNPELIISVNNTPFIQLFNFPHLARIKMYFWGRNNLRITSFKNEKFKHTPFPPSILHCGKKTLSKYNEIPSIELYDSELLRGFSKEIYINYLSGAFESEKYVVFLFDQLKKFTAHLKHQAETGKKFIVGAPLPNESVFQLFHNGTLNAISSFYYKTDLSNGLFLAHNYMNTLHTVDKMYVEDTKKMLDFILLNSTSLTATNEVGRNTFFKEIDDQIDYYANKVKRS